VTHAVGLTLVSVGCAVVVLSAVGAAVLPGGVVTRLHFLTPVTSVGIPLVAVGLCVENGQPFTVVEILLIALLVSASGPVLESATGRAAVIAQGLIGEEEPE
jgi:multisubunit Na+/H+ antiporter MnhG subunit